LKREVDLNDFLGWHPVLTFFARVQGLDMIHAGIRDGDILVVDFSRADRRQNRTCHSYSGLTIKYTEYLTVKRFLESQKTTVFTIVYW